MAKTYNSKHSRHFSKRAGIERAVRRQLALMTVCLEEHLMVHGTDAVPPDGHALFVASGAARVGYGPRSVPRVRRLRRRLGRRLRRG